MDRRRSPHDVSTDLSGRHRLHAQADRPESELPLAINLPTAESLQEGQIGVRWQVTVKHALLAEPCARPSRLEPDRCRSGAAIGHGFRTRSRPTLKTDLGFNLVRQF